MSRLKNIIPSCWILALLNYPSDVALVLAQLQAKDYPQSLITLIPFQSLWVEYRYPKLELLSLRLWVLIHRFWEHRNGPQMNPAFIEAGKSFDEHHGRNIPLPTLDTITGDITQHCYVSQWSPLGWLPSSLSTNHIRSVHLIRSASTGSQ